MAWVLKARYFSYSNFINSGLGSNSSFVWRSTVWGEQLLDKRFYWRIGCDRRISIYNDKWLPHPSSFKVISPLALPLHFIVPILFWIMVNRTMILLNPPSFVRTMSSILVYALAKITMKTFWCCTSMAKGFIR